MKGTNRLVTGHRPRIGTIPLGFGGPFVVLRELSVQNLALIEDVQVELEGGFCAWTGETGAGKSLLLTALGLVLGGKASADLGPGGQGRGPGFGSL